MKGNQNNEKAMKMMRQQIRMDVFIRFFTTKQNGCVYKIFF